MSDLPRCSMCGRVADDPAALGWGMDVTERGLQYICPDCARTNIRGIEAKLSQEWW